MFKKMTVLSFFLIFNGAAHSKLPKSVQIDQKEALIIRALKDKNNIDCPVVIQNTNELEQLTGKVPTVLYYYRASCLSLSGNNTKALHDLETYFSVNKKKDGVYEKALVLYSTVEDKTKAEAEIERQRIAAKQQQVEMERLAQQRRDAKAIKEREALAKKARLENERTSQKIIAFNRLQLMVEKTINEFCSSTPIVSMYLTSFNSPRGSAVDIINCYSNGQLDFLYLDGSGWESDNEREYKYKTTHSKQINITNMQIKITTSKHKNRPAVHGNIQIIYTPHTKHPVLYRKLRIDGRSNGRLNIVSDRSTSEQNGYDDTAYLTLHDVNGKDKKGWNQINRLKRTLDELQKEVRDFSQKYDSNYPSYRNGKKPEIRKMLGQVSSTKLQERESKLLNLFVNGGYKKLPYLR